MIPAGREPERLIGESAAMRALHEDLLMAARSDAKVLITGETGVGKDVVARLIHASSPRRHAALAAINCAGVPDSLMESELFGHMRGSFTDAHRDRIGILEGATRGTAFLDEVGEMSLRMQAALLRFLETGEIQRVGAERGCRMVDVRIIAATNRDLLPAIEAGAFRQDLYYRLNVVRLVIPPLRERREDIPLLLDHFLERYAAEHRVPGRRLSPDALHILVDYAWPGNVRQLKNVVERMILRPPRPTIEVDDLPREVVELRKAPTVAAGAACPEVSTAAVDHAERMLEGGESFWSAVYGPFMSRDLPRADLRRIIERGLDRTAGNYRMMVELFNMPQSDYKRFLTFLRKHNCHVGFRSYRRPPAAPARPRPTLMSRAHSVYGASEFGGRVATGASV